MMVYNMLHVRAYHVCVCMVCVEHTGFEAINANGAGLVGLAGEAAIGDAPLVP